MYRALSSAGELRGKRIIVRVDFNVPVKDGVVVDDFRIQATLPTLQLLKKVGAQLVLISHIGDDGKDTLKPVADFLSKVFPVAFAQSINEARIFLEEGKSVLLENIRRFDGEMSNDEAFSHELSSLGNIYVNEAFSVSHRAHASIVGIPRFIPGYAGLRFDREMVELGKALRPEHPFMFILGGAKFETKLPLIEKFLRLADSVFVGGALANDVLRALHLPIGRSVVSEMTVSDAIINNQKFLKLLDVTVSTSGGEKIIKDPKMVTSDDMILDVGPKTISALSQKIKESRMVLWNGPLGVYEKGFTEQTEALAREIAESETFSIVGGGDTLASIQKLNLMDRFGFVSTGGGAMLEFLLHGTLPGIEALERSLAAR